MQPRRRGLSLGRPFGSSLLVSGSWLPAGALLVALLAASVYDVRPLSQALILSASAVVALFVLVVLHDVAHLAAGRLVGVSTRQVRLFVFGGVRSVSAGSARAEMAAALAGPVFSGACGAALLWGSRMAAGSIADLLEISGVLAVGLAAINVIPAPPLDGGVVWAAMREWRTGDRAGSRRQARRFGRMAGLLLAVVGGAGVAMDPWAVPESTAGLWMFLAGLFVVSQAGSAVDETLPKATGNIGDWARPFAGRLDAGAALPLREDGPYAVSEEGRLAGVLLPRRPGEGARMGDVRESMIPWDPALAVDERVPASQALRRLARSEVPLLVVLDAEGVVKGVVDVASVRSRVAGRTM